MVEASGLPPLRNDVGGDANSDFAGLRKGPGAGQGDGVGRKGGGVSGAGKTSKLLPSVVLAQQAQKLTGVRTPPACTGGGSGGEAAAAAHPFVAVTLERARPQVGLLVGHTNTEYGTQAPVFGRNAQPKACPHGGKPREAFVAAGAAKLLPAAGGTGQQHQQQQQPAFLFYAPQVRTSTQRKGSQTNKTNDQHHCIHTPHIHCRPTSARCTSASRSSTRCPPPATPRSSLPRGAPSSPAATPSRGP